MAGDGVYREGRFPGVNKGGRMGGWVGTYSTVKQLWQLYCISLQDVCHFPSHLPTAV